MEDKNPFAHKSEMTTFAHQTVPNTYKAECASTVGNDLST